MNGYEILKFKHAVEKEKSPIAGAPDKPLTVYVPSDCIGAMTKKTLKDGTEATVVFTLGHHIFLVLESPEEISKMLKGAKNG